MKTTTEQTYERIATTRKLQSDLAAGKSILTYQSLSDAERRAFEQIIETITNELERREAAK